MLVSYHDLIHSISHYLGHQYNDGAPEWLHPVLHVVMLYAPVLLIIVIVIWIIRRSYAAFQKHNTVPKKTTLAPVPGLDANILQYILRFSKRQQFILVLASVMAMPILYVTLELPKQIINNALDAQQFPKTMLSIEFTQVELLIALCALYLLAISINGLHKYCLNVFKGKVAERFLRRLRLTIYRRWRGLDQGKQTTDIIPIVVQEVEPIGGFASDFLALPIFQGGTMLTIILFMFVQEPVLGLAAIAILPIQLILLPRLQRRLNVLTRFRIQEVRILGAELGDQIARVPDQRTAIHRISSRLKRIERVRQDIHRMKFFIKVLNNFLTALTPFFFYALGGYFVIEGRITLGALVAVLAAHKDFSAPLKELFRYYQSLEDVRIRYAEVSNYLARDR